MTNNHQVPEYAHHICLFKVQCATIAALLRNPHWQTGNESEWKPIDQVLKEMKENFNQMHSVSFGAAFAVTLEQMYKAIKTQVEMLMSEWDKTLKDNIVSLCDEGAQLPVS